MDRRTFALAATEHRSRHPSEEAEIIVEVSTTTAVTRLRCEWETSRRKVWKFRATKICSDELK
jgi:hypothetical protein